MEPIPLECKLSLPDLRTQRDRYRRVAESVTAVDRSANSLSAQLDPAVDAALVDELVEIEHECCPFFRIEWHREAGRLAFAVDAQYALALDAIADLLSPA